MYGTCPVSGAYPPLLEYSSQQVDWAGQMSHVIKDDGLNIYRLPVGWQFLVNDNVGGPLDPTNIGKYDALVQACLSTGACCILDIHSLARWNGQIIGQDGPSDGQFANLWSQLATKYARGSAEKVVAHQTKRSPPKHILIYGETAHFSTTTS